MQRYGWVIGIRPEAIAQYKQYHAQVWPEVLEMIRQCHIRNYSIYFKDHLLFGYYEYHGSDHAADMARMAAHPKTQEWWATLCPLLEPLPTCREGELWAGMEEVFHLE